jgi:hypothetical protein
MQRTLAAARERAKQVSRETNVKRPKWRNGDVGGRGRAREPADRRLQLRVVALCTLVQICDGYDLNSVTGRCPLIKAWQSGATDVHHGILWSSIGILAGALSAGPTGDRFVAPAVARQPDDLRSPRCSARRPARSAC